MAELDAEGKLAFLLEPASQALLQRLCADSREDLALSGSPELRSLSVPFRHTLLEQRKLRTKAMRKCPLAAEMIFTATGLEQLTHFELARYKVSRLPPDIHSIADLCCGLGGDSFYLPGRIRVIGVDRSRSTIMAYRHNVSLHRRALSIQADVTANLIRCDAALLDPSRRPTGKSDRWQGEDLSPGWDVIEKLISRHGNMAIKLGPGLTLPTFLEDHEIEYLGLRDECLEALVWTGQLGRPGWVKAVELPSGAFVDAPRADLADTFGRTGSPGTYLFEPVKSVVRSHLFGVLAARHSLWQLDPRIAYLSGNEPVNSPLLKSYQVLKELPYDFKVLREFLRKEEVGRLEVKKRGVNLIPEEFRSTLRLAGPNEGTLVFTKVMDRKTVFWARRI